TPTRALAIQHVHARHSLPDSSCLSRAPSLSGVGRVLYLPYVLIPGDEEGVAIDIDRDDNVWIAGSTGSEYFPTTSGAAQSALSRLQDSADAPDAFVARFNTNQSGDGSLTFSTYLGGDFTEETHGLSVGGPATLGYV